MKYKLGTLVAFLVLYAIFYIYPNFFATAEPHYLHLFWVDRDTPFLPWTFLIYTSDYFIFIVVMYLLKTKEEFLHMSRMCFMTLFICGMFFLFYPTTYPRPEYPEVTNPLIKLAMYIVGTWDMPRNCFPSMHVALTGVATWSMRHFPRPIFYFFCIWTLLIYVSTLTTKQHYLMDVFGGIGVVFLVSFLEKQLSKRLQSRAR